MRTLVLLGVVGLVAQLVDGSLGMAYGVTSTTLLLAVGTGGAAASATVHLAEIGTTLASGAAHWRFGNVDWKVVVKIGVPGAIGSFAGATFLSRLSTEAAEPVMSLILLALGLYVAIRFTAWGMPRARLHLPLRNRFLAPLGLVAGFVAAPGGDPLAPYTCSCAVHVTVCTDPSDPGSSERNSDTGYWDGAESSLDYCDNAARTTARYEGEHQQLTQVPAHLLSMLS